MYSCTLYSWHKNLFKQKILSWLYPYYTLYGQATSLKAVSKIRFIQALKHVRRFTADVRTLNWHPPDWSWSQQSKRYKNYVWLQRSRFIMHYCNTLISMLLPVLTIFSNPIASDSNLGIFVQNCNIWSVGFFNSLYQELSGYVSQIPLVLART